MMTELSSEILTLKLFHLLYDRLAAYSLGVVTFTHSPWGLGDFGHVGRVPEVHTSDL